MLNAINAITIGIIIGIIIGKTIGVLLDSFADFLYKVQKKRRI